jgi:hypothetical protein
MKKLLLFSLFAIAFLLTINTAQAGNRNFIAYKANTAPTIDGIGNDTCWQNAKWYPINVLWQGAAVDSFDFYGRFKLAWNAQKLFVLVEINDNVLSDQFPDPLVNYWQDDCVELFIDENHSGGDHQYNFNAFAYHVSTLYDVVDLGPDQATHLFNDNIQVLRTNVGDYYTWEFAVTNYGSNYVIGDTNTPVVLTTNKIMGFSIAYCDNDGTFSRETFMGSDPNSDGGDNHWINASEFATLTLLDTAIQDTTTPPNSVIEVTKDFINLYPNPAKDYVNILFNDKTNSNCNVQIYNLSGEIVKGTIVQSGEKSFPVYVGDINRGVYFIEINSENYRSVQKVVLI